MIPVTFTTVGQMPPVEIQDRFQSLLLGKSRAFDALPTQRRHAIHFRYGDVSDNFSMRNMAAMIPSLRGNEVNDSSSTYRALQVQNSHPSETVLADLESASKSNDRGSPGTTARLGSFSADRKASQFSIYLRLARYCLA